MRLATRLLPGLTCVLAAVANADTFYVNGTCGNDAWTGLSQTCNAPNGPKRTIQAGIDTSVTGDTISVADGTYTGVGNKNLDYGGRLITLRSENGPAACIIDCEDDGRGFHFHNGETADAVLEGFTIRDGNVGGANGGAILCESASPTILNCVLESNLARRGGGLFSSGGNPTINNCTISANTAMFGDGGGLYLSGGSTTATDCTFDRNFVIGSGGGLYNESNSSLTLTNCTLSENNGTRLGGGLYNAGSTTATDCAFVRNECDTAGAGIYNLGSATVTNCTFRGNYTFLGGAMANVSGSSAAVTNSTFIGNHVDRFAGGIYNENSSPTVTNCTFSANSGQGSGMLNRFSDSRPTVTNCIFWNDGASNIVDADGAESTVRFSDVRGAWPGLGNIDADPLFVRLPDPGPDGWWGTLDDDYGDLHLLPDSPCIDAADNTAVPPDITTDFDGNPRFVDDPATPDCQWAPGTCGDPPIVDMGAYEFQGVCDPCDMNCDGDVNAFDIEPFLGILFDGDEPCAPCTGDTNGDDNVDAFDIEPFLTCLFGP